MNYFANALGADFLKNKDMVRTRSFEMGGHTFKVKVPLTSEFEAMQKRMEIADKEKSEKYYQTLAAPLADTTGSKAKIEKTKDDIIVDGHSLREMAKNKVLMQNRITEMFKLLVPAEEGFDMSTITYEMVEELFPFPVQMQLVEAISKVISPGYESEKGK